MAASCCPGHGRFCLILLLAEHKHGAATGTRMPIVHQLGPCSPLADKHGKAPSHEEILAADQPRVEYIHRRVTETTGQVRPKRAAPPSAPSVQLQPTPLSSSAASAKLLASSGNAVGTGNYVVAIGLGTPEERLTVVFDTGSDTTWVQCQPCVESCYPQQEPLFTPAKSSTYANISCSSSYCSDLDIRGLRLFWRPLPLRRPEFRFRCGEDNRGLFGRSAGRMDLGRGKTSLTAQARDKYGVRDRVPGPRPAANARLTPMLTDKGPTFYYVGLTGIKEDGRPLPIPESFFFAAGALVDSGTVITRLPPKAYSPLRSAFAKAMEDLGYKKAPGVSILDTCYDLEGGEGKALPAVSMAFQGGASLDVDASGILYMPKTHGVLYDLGNKVVGFVPGAC
uniref:Peptidase A1 domain-containing protein n=1 Tax=Setaria viridis TaxID=4556 RepID=A0A4U6SYT4_SETVI|nr:hypothetical protein SEVIR_9G217300v2 [Setaria viridis]